MATCNAQTLIDGAGGFACLSEGDRWTVLLKLFCNIWKASVPMAQCDVQTLLDDGACFQFLSDGDRWAILLQLACEILSGGGTGKVCITCVSEAPTGDGPCDCSIAFGKHGSAVAGSVWTWDVDSGIWDLIIGGP